jgi:hypothetical protein
MWFMRDALALVCVCWAWIVGRFFIFGVTPDCLVWRAHFTSESWYRLTPIRWGMPWTWFPWLPLAMAILSVPFYWSPLWWCVLIEQTVFHAWFPLFAVQRHRGLSMAICILAITCAITRWPYVCVYPIWAIHYALSMILYMWFALIQIQTLCVPVCHEPLPMTERQPRTI